LTGQSACKLFLRHYSTDDVPTNPNSADNPYNPAADLPRVQEYANLGATSNLIAARKALAGLSGVYAIICQATGAIYIGSSMNLGTRMREHIIESSNAHLRNAIDGY